MDVRWAGDSSVLIAAGKAGVWEVFLKGGAAPEVVIPGGRGPGRFWLASRLARSATHLVVAPPVFSLAWRSEETATLREEPFDAIVDLDVFEDRFVVLGARKDGEGRFSTDGAIAWQGKLAAGLDDLDPIYYSLSGPGAKPMADCWILELGAVRFLRDGSFLVVPGVEPGLYWYDASGSLKRAWESEALGLDGACSGTRPGLAANPEAQFAWVNQRRVLDDILPLPAGPGLLLRDVVDGVTRWHLKVLHPDGSITTGEVPVTSTTGQAHLRGDVRGSRVALLVVEYGRERPAATPRLVIAEVRE